MAENITLIGAYGRRYNYPSDALKAWNAGMDFLIVGHNYCSIRDFDRLTRLNNSVIIRCNTGEIVKLFPKNL